MRKQGLFIIISSLYWLIHILYETYKRLFFEWDYWGANFFEFLGWSLYIVIPMSLISLGWKLYNN